MGGEFVLELIKAFWHSLEIMALRVIEYLGLKKMLFSAFWSGTEFSQERKNR
jgi:hypothetical protein